MSLIGNYRNNPRPCVLTIGNFDGVHLGHKQLLEQLGYFAKSHKLAQVVITFEPQSSEFFAKSSPVNRVYGWRDKVAYLLKSGVDGIRTINFNLKFSNLSAEQFVVDYVLLLQAKYVIIGHDFCFGRGAQAGSERMFELGKKYGFTVRQIAALADDDGAINSSRIRKLLTQGDLPAVKNCLGRDYQLSGRVVHGNRLARSLGFPTANLKMYNRNLPLRGVFAAQAFINGLTKSWMAAINVGHKPTVGGINRLVVEAHLLDYHGNLYGALISLRFICYLRAEKKFENLLMLSSQVESDLRDTRKILNKKNLN